MVRGHRIQRRSRSAATRVPRGSVAVVRGVGEQPELEPAARAMSGDSSGTHLWLVLMKAHRSMSRHAQRSITAHDIGFSDFLILEILLHKGPLLISDIGRRIQLTSGSITTAIDRLEERDLVARAADAGGDRRAKQV